MGQVGVAERLEQVEVVEHQVVLGQVEVVVHLVVQGQVVAVEHLAQQVAAEQVLFLMVRVVIQIMNG